MHNKEYFFCKIYCVKLLNDSSDIALLASSLLGLVFMPCPLNYLAAEAIFLMSEIYVLCIEIEIHRSDSWKFAGFFPTDRRLLLLAACCRLKGARNKFPALASLNFEGQNKGYFTENFDIFFAQ